MGPQVNELVARARLPEPFSYSASEIWKIQLGALNERFDEGCAAIPALARRAAEAGIQSIKSRHDLLPFLFSSGTYQSYPDSAVRNKKWQLLTNWLNSYSAIPAAPDVDFTGVESIDDWMGRLRGAGHIVFASGGARGKASLYDQSQTDLDLMCDLVTESLRWATGARPDQSRHAFLLFPKNSTHNYTTVFRTLADRYGRPDSTHWLSDEPMLVSASNRAGELRHEIGLGKARPSDIEALAQEGAARAAKVEENFEVMVSALVAHAAEPCMILGPWGMHWRLVQRLQDLGFPGLHPDSIVEAGGSLKLAGDYPSDFQQQISTTYGKALEKFWKSYGMAEVPSQLPRCPSMRYHLPPWVVPVIVDKDGRLAEPVGQRIEGRMAMVDLAVGGRWGGFASGDQVTMDTGACECGRLSPTVVEIAPLANLAAADDKLSCAGTVDAYVRGVVEQ